MKILSQTQAANQVSNFGDSNQASAVLQFEELKTKFDVQVLSNSLVLKVGDYLAARILQQLHYWNHKEYGVVLKGLRWIYKPIREWLCESIIGFSKYQIQKAIAFLIEENWIWREQLFSLHHGKEYAYCARNRTYYYAINYSKLNPETTRAIGFPVSHQSDFQSSTNLIDGLSENNTKNTSTENITKETPPLTPPVSSEGEPKTVNSEEAIQDPSPRKRSQNPPPRQLIKDSNDEPSSQAKTKTSSQAVVCPKQLKLFYDVLVSVLPNIANARCPEAVAKVIIKDVKDGLPNSYWDDYQAGKPIGHSSKPEWEGEPGIPYPKFVEYLRSKLAEPYDTPEKTLFKVTKTLKDKLACRLLWQDFKRIVEGLRQDSDRSTSSGQQSNIPSWFIDRADVSVERAEESARTLNKKLGSQTDWVNKGLPGHQQGKAILGSPQVELLPSPVLEGTTTEKLVTPSNIENFEVNFGNWKGDLNMLITKAKSIALSPSKLSLWLVDFRAAINNATSEERLLIRSAIAPIYPPLLELIS